MTQRPDLFGAAVPAVGVLDMLRFHKFTIGWAWVSDYGSADNPEEFKALYAYSPLHNVKKGTVYPPTLITTADHDDRVVPAHSFKFAAALQAAQEGNAPILLRIETRAGHGQGLPTTKHIELATDALAFFFNTLGMQAPASAAQLQPGDRQIIPLGDLKVGELRDRIGRPAQHRSASFVTGPRRAADSDVGQRDVPRQVRVLFRR